ncbi:extracellular solute-binding protein [Sporosarcina sp. FSL K6-3457]|uniref:extracellular solute-binding protein n=1 Tax=Sporosarcina sp. FSL K6-3457 TaxID=2978204 RepID=UPI0030FACB27
MNIKKIGIVGIVLALALFQHPNPAIHAQNQKGETKGNTVVEGEASILESKYSAYIQEHKGKPYQGDDVVLDKSENWMTDTALLTTIVEKTALRIKQNEEASITIQAPETASYIIGLQYSTEGDNILPTQLEMKVNGQFPFYELRNLLFESRWQVPDETPKDKYGNEIVPQPSKVQEWQEKFISDASYRSSEPFYIELQKGDNDITLRTIEGNILIQSIVLTSADELVDYPEGQVEGHEFIVIEGENSTYKNDSSIRASSLYNVDLTPYSAGKRVLNYLDSDSFKKPGHTVEYEFEVAKAGYYYLGMNYRQSAKIDFPVFVNMTIDGDIPFKQYQNYPFDYTSEFTHMTIRDAERDKDIPIYLERGKHTIGLTISLDHIKSTIEKVEQLTKEIQTLSLELTKLAGPSIDRNRDIDVEKYIPGVTKQLETWTIEIRDLYEGVKKYNPNVAEIGAFSSLTIAEKQLKGLSKNVDKLIVRKNELSTGTNSITAHLGNLLQEIINNGLAIDKLYFYQDAEDIPQNKGFMKKQLAKVERLTKSFGEQDYAIDNVNPDHLQVWVNRPRQYIEIIQQLIDEQFTPTTGIQVDISLMPDENKLILSNASGDAPDVAVGVNYALPFEIAIRGALQDLTEFADFDEVQKRFPEGLHVPATVKDGIFALPDTMNFWVLFYRKDILDSLGLPVPETLEQVKSYLPELQRKGMNFFYPTAGMPGLKTFASTMPIIYQNGGHFYGDTIGRTTLNEEASIEGMRQLTELFTIYNMPYEVPSFYQQFRDTSLPIGISDYFMYNMTLNAAPEIANSWDIALMPGIENEEGEIERWSAGGAESNIIFEDSAKKEEAWEFLKWWSSTDVQIAFGNNLQTTYGKEYIWNTANIEAFEGLPWATNHKNVILEQTEWVTEVPRVPGSYMLEREISNAYNSIVLDGENFRTAIDLASKRINRETFRKLEEFGYMKNGEMIEPYPSPEFTNE